MVFARMQAACAWCAPSTEHIEMNCVLAEEFAKILVKEMYAPHLGCVSTGELLQEIQSRSDLAYRTVRCECPDCNRTPAGACVEG